MWHISVINTVILSVVYSVCMAATTTQKLGGKGLMIVTAQVMHLPANDTYPATMIPIALIAQSSKDAIMVIIKHYIAIDDDHHSTITTIYSS